MPPSLLPRCVPAAFAALLVLAAAPADAAELKLTPGLLNQQEFRALSEDLGAALSYKSMVPAEPLGVLGFDLGVGLSATRLEHGEIWRRAGASDVKDRATVATLRAVKGLPLDLDVGLALAQVPDTGIKLTGGELRWAFLPGGVVTPAVALRLAMTRLSGVDTLRFDTRSAELTLSKGFLMATPYAGLGVVTLTSAPAASTGLQKESFSQRRVFAGLNLNLGLSNLAVEVDRTGDASSASLKLGFRF